jgi:acyl carrier protein
MDHEHLLKVILNRHFSIEPERVTPETRFEEDLSMDDVEQSELQELVEKEFKIVFTPYEVDNMFTVQDCLDFIRNKES